MQPKQFKIKPGGFKEIQRKYLLFFVPLILLAGGTGIAISHFSKPDKNGDLTAMFIAIPVSLFVIVFSIYRSVNRQKALFESYNLSLDKYSIVRRQSNTPTVCINHDEIKEIIIDKNRNISIQTNQSLNCIMVPAQIENYDELVEALNGIRPVSQKKYVSLFQKYSILLSMLGLGLMAGVFLSTNKVIVTLAGSLLTSAIIWSIYVGVKSKNVDQRTKKGLIWVGVLLFAIIGKVVLILLDKYR